MKDTGVKAIIEVHNQTKEIKSNRAWREECESLRQRVKELEQHCVYLQTYTAPTIPEEKK